MEQKTHIIPTGLEYERVVWGLERFGVSKVILLRGHGEVELKIDPFVDKLKERYTHLVETDMLQEVYLDIFNLGQVFGICKSLIETEAALGQVYINISSSTKLLAVGLLMSAWCSDVSGMKSRPILYYARPESYVSMNLPDYASRVDDVLGNFDSLLKSEPSAIYALLQELGRILTDFRESGTAIGRGDIIMVPFMPVSLPSDFEMGILAILETFGGEVARIEDIAKAQETEQGSRGGRRADVATRSKVAYHLRNLENRQLIEKVPSGRGTRVRITDLGRVFVRPRILKAREEE